MRLMDRLSRTPSPEQSKSAGARPAEVPEPRSASMKQPPPKQVPLNPEEDLPAISARLHDQVIDRLDLAQIAQLDKGELRGRLTAVVSEVVQQEQIALNRAERDYIVQGILDEIMGLGPLEPLLADPAVSDVLVNGPHKVYIERAGKLERTDVRFRDDAHLIHTIRRIVARIGRRIDESSPMVDARLQDGSRVNAIIPPLAIDGPSLSIRRFGTRPLGPQDLITNAALVPSMLQYLQAAVRSKCSVLVAGGTGAGKTTLLNILSSFIPEYERIVTIEDAAELRMQQDHVVRLESRPPNLEGQGEVTIRDLVKNALRMRPDRIIVGEVRGSEVLDMLQAMNTGHEGSLATVHANSARDAISRLMTMLGMGGTKFSEEIMAQLISRGIHVIVHLARHSDGRRRISSIMEITGQNGSEVTAQEIFAFQASGVGPDGKIRGRFVRTGNTQFADRFALGEAAEEIG